MAQDEKLPEGTDTIIAGASETGSGGTTSNIKTSGGTTSGGTTPTVRDKIRSGGEKISGQAADKARGFVAQGIERSSEAMSSVAKMISDTAEGIDERLGAEYGDYARRAGTAIDDAARKLSQKDADELIDDTRDFVRKSPGVALAGAAIVGFALARLIKSGLDTDRNDRTGDRS